MNVLMARPEELVTLSVAILPEQYDALVRQAQAFGRSPEVWAAIAIQKHLALEAYERAGGRLRDLPTLDARPVASTPVAQAAP